VRAAEPCEWPTRPTVGSGVSPNRAAISAGRRSSSGRTTGLTNGFGWLPITGSMSRACPGVPWERGGPRLAPPAGAVRLNAKAGLLTPLV
jgi:hypothetical protein